jgi:hypothetical protein
MLLKPDHIDEPRADPRKALAPKNEHAKLNAQID